MTVDLEDAQEDKLQTTCGFEADGDHGPSPAIPSLGDDSDEEESQHTSDEEDADAASTSSKPRAMQGLQRELALEALGGCGFSKCLACLKCSDC